MGMATNALAASKTRSVSAPTAPATRRARRVRRPAALPPIGPAWRAFSLLEVVLVLVILAIAAAIAVPRHAAAVARYRAESAARRLAADLVQARSLARQTSADQTVVFDPAADCYTLASLEDPDRPGRPYTVALADRPYYADLTDAAFSEGASVTFDGFGAADQGGTVSVRAGDYLWIVTVDGESGEVTTSGPCGGS